MPLSLSVVIPAYNESARLGKTLRNIFANLNYQNPDSEVIVVDDGSTDRTPEIAEQSFIYADNIEARVIRLQSNLGKGAAVRAGLLAARAPIALFTDADLSTPITEIPKLVGMIERREQDVVFGSRALDRNMIGTHQPWSREQGGRVMNFIIRRATGLPFWDTQCGFKAFRMAVCRPVIEAGIIDRFGFDVELLYIAHLAKLRLREVPVRWNHCDGSKLRVGRDTVKMISELRTIVRQARRGLYDTAISQARMAHPTHHAPVQDYDTTPFSAGEAQHDLHYIRAQPDA